MTHEDSPYKKAVVVKRTVLGYELDSVQDVYANYLVPSVLGFLLYVLQFAADFVCAYRHFREHDPIWGFLTLFFMYLPVLGCYVMIMSSLELWPEMDECDGRNVKWATVKTLQHLFFPIWSTWRYAEKIFWSIEAVLAETDEKRRENLQFATAPRTIEFYFFLQAFLQGIPQIMLQVHILMRFTNLLELQTVQVMSMSAVVNLVKLATTTALYQRFKTQMVGGKEYPWHKSYKTDYTFSGDAVDGPNRRSFVPKPKLTGIVYATKDNVKKIKQELKSNNSTRAPSVPKVSNLRRTSSDSYLAPKGEVENELLTRETSVIDGHLRAVYTEGGRDEVDFPRRLRDIKGLPDDDIVGKLISILWWFCFLLTRMLTISSFAYFYPRDICWILSAHFILVVAFLLYDVQAYVVHRTKAVFYIFIGLVYIFCIIEFKKKFKKVKFVYFGYFSLVFLQNFTMCFVWWFGNLESNEIYDDWWFRYIFWLVITFTILSMLAMLFYLYFNKPEKVTVDTEVINNIPSSKI